jgi:hypothetical protein
MASNDQAILAEWSKQRDNEAVTNGDGESAIRLMIFVRRIVVWPTPPMPLPQQGWGDGVVEGHGGRH